MKKLTRAIIIITCLSLFSGCSKEDMQEFQAGLDCDVNHTSVVTFENRSTTGLSYDVFWNSVRVVNNLKPGEKSRAEAYSVGSHTYVFKKAGTNIISCSPGYPNLAQCHSYTFYCEK